MKPKSGSGITVCAGELSKLSLSNRMHLRSGTVADNSATHESPPDGAGASNNETPVYTERLDFSIASPGPLVLETVIFLR